MNIVVGTDERILHLDNNGFIQGGSLNGSHISAGLDPDVQPTKIAELFERARHAGAATAHLPFLVAGVPVLSDITLAVAPEGFTWLVRDRQQADASIHAARLMRLELMTHEVQEYGRLAVHGIRSPMMALRWQAELASRGVPTDPNRTIELTDAALRALESILSYGRIRLGRLHQCHGADLAAALQSVFPPSLQCQMSGRLRADPILLKRALRQLIGHAYKRGAKSVEVTNEVDGAYIIHIDHDGPALSSAALKSVWSPFLDDPQGRHGLAMASARKAIHLHGGHIAALPQGFRIRIPINGPQM